MCQKRCCWKYWKWGCHLKNRYWKNIYVKVENARTNFSVSPDRTPWVSRKENLRFFEVALAVVLCNDVVGSIMNMWGYLHWNTANTIPDLYLFVKPIKCTTTIDFRLGSDFINLEHLSCPTLVLPFKLRKGKCWLEVRCELFVKNNTEMLTYTHICISLINSKIVQWSRHTNFNLKSIEIEKVFP